MSREERTGRRWPKRLGCAALVVGPIGLVALFFVAVAVVFTAVAAQFSSCGGGFRVSGPNRVDCARSDSALVRATTTAGGAAVARELRRGGRAGVPDGKGNTALACAAMVGNVRAVEALVAAGADPRQRGTAGGRPIVAAVSGEGSYPGDGESNSFFASLDDPARRRIVRVLAGAGADPAAALSPAVDRSDPAMVRTLLDLGASANGERGAPAPLTVAAFRGSSEIVGLLLARGADPNAGGEITASEAFFALLDASATSTTSTTSASGGSNPSTLPIPSDLPTDAKGEVPPLVAAIFASKREAAGSIVQALLAAGARPDRLAFGRYPALWAAAVVGDRPDALRLLAAGADPRPEGKDVARPLDAARRANDPAMVALIEQAPDQPG